MRYCSDDCQIHRKSVKGGGEQGRVTRDRPPVPKGTEYAELVERPNGTGTVTSGPKEAATLPADARTNWDWLLEMHGLDPAHFEIVDDTVNARTWDAHYGKDQPSRKFVYYKAEFRKKGGAVGLDFDALRTAYLSTSKPRKLPTLRSKPVTFVAVVSDPQFGKGDGDGTPGTWQRVENGIDAACELIERYRAEGMNIADVLAPWLGDNTENTQGHYAMQTFTTDLTLTEQIEMTTDAGVLANKRLLEVAPIVLNASVPGNHGEVRDGGGKAYTRFGDNMDTHGLKQAAKILRATPGYASRSLWAFPDGDSLSLTLRVRDRVHTFLHGHQGRVSAPTAHTRIVRWLADQALGMREAGEAEFVWSGHYHHTDVIEVGRRVFVQAPALDGGSLWYAETAGVDTPPGMFTGVLTGQPGIAGLTRITVLAGNPLPPPFAIAA